MPGTATTPHHTKRTRRRVVVDSISDRIAGLHWRAREQLQQKETENQEQRDELNILRK